MLFYGYKLNGRTIKEIQSELKPCKEKIQEIGDHLYHELIGKEAAFLGDCITLNVMERNLEENYFLTALDNVNFWIRNYNIRRLYGDYNFSLYGYLFDYKNHTYLRVDFHNLAFKDAFNDFEEISISKMDYEIENGFQSDFWHYATEYVKKAEPLSINLSPNLDFKMKKIIMPSKEWRVAEWTRHQELNRILDSLRFDQNPIAPARLMYALDMAYATYIEKEHIDAEAGKMLADKMSLKNLLLDYNKEENKNLLKPKKTEEKEILNEDIENDIPKD